QPGAQVVPEPPATPGPPLTSPGPTCGVGTPRAPRTRQSTWLSPRQTVAHPGSSAHRAAWPPGPRARVRCTRQTAPPRGPATTGRYTTLDPAGQATRGPT